MATTAKAQTFPDGADQPKSKIKILGNVYGGGDQAAVQGNTKVEINKGQFAGDIFGGGNGALYTAADEAADPAHIAGTVKASADIGTHNDDGTIVENTGATSVTIKGGEVIFDNDHPSNHNIYGGGNLACNVAGSTDVQMNTGMVTWYTFLSNQEAVIPQWYDWYDQAMQPNKPKSPICAVFGAGYGKNTDVASNTSVTIDIPGTTDITIPDDDGIYTKLEEIDQIIMRWMPDHRLVGQFVTATFGGGYDGTVGAYDATAKTIKYDKDSYTSQTNVTIKGNPFLYNVFGGGLGSEAGAAGDYMSHVGAIYGGSDVNIEGGIINGSVFGGGAGIRGTVNITSPITADMPYVWAGQVFRETDVKISGDKTVVYGNVYGGGDIANTGWYSANARPKESHQANENHYKAKLDYTTSLHLNGGHILGKVFGGGNGRPVTEIEQYKFVGAVFGNTNVVVDGSTVWNDIYGGGKTGSVFSCKYIADTNHASYRNVEGRKDGCTNVYIKSGKVAQDIFGGGWGNEETVGNVLKVSSADVTNNTYVFFEDAKLEWTKYWRSREIADASHMGSWENPTGEVTGNFSDQKTVIADGLYQDAESDINHNLYGGGNVACEVGGHAHIHMTSAPEVPASFATSDYYKQCVANVGKPHFSSFGGGFGVNAIVKGNTYSDIRLKAGAAFYSVIGGGMNGPVGGTCLVHVGANPKSVIHSVYGGGYYANCGGTDLHLTSGFIRTDVFGGSVMGNVGVSPLTQYATQTTIGFSSDNPSLIIKTEDDINLDAISLSTTQNNIVIGGNVYGANDVAGRVYGISDYTEAKITDFDGNFLKDASNNDILALGSANLTIYGGTINGDVYGAGNGDHIGYYEPNLCEYYYGKNEGNYFLVDHTSTGGPKGNTYTGRPQTESVKMTIAGNATDQRVNILGQVFGGGNSCTIGDWSATVLEGHGSNPHLTRDDPDYFLGGGKLDITLGSHIRIGRTHAELADATDGANYLIEVEGMEENVSGLYMGCSGRHLATQDWSKTDNNYHHYYDANTHKYWPGFAVYEENSATPLSRANGLKSFNAYMNNILVWSDDVNLNINSDADDIWISNFVGGGFRGSMKAKTAEGQFHYTLPRGVTIGHDVIGGAFNTDVVYRIFETSDGHTYTEENGHYKYLTDKGTLTQADEGNTTGDYHHIEYAADGTTVTGIARFYYDGGMLTSDPEAMANHVGAVQRAYNDAGGSNQNKGFSGPTEDAARAFRKYKNKALVLLTLNNKLQTEKIDGHVHGGNVFGGCFSSGRVEGDIWTDYLCYLESSQSRDDDFNLSEKNFANAKDFENNFAMMLFGAGYGANTRIDGDVYVRVLHQEANPSSPISGAAIGYPRLYNVFGGSFEGKVKGDTNIFFNPGKYGYIAGGLYGGGCNGYVGGKTFLEITGGYINDVYGGARNANIGGGTHIWAYDGAKRWWAEDVVHSNGDPMSESDAEKAPLVIGRIFGGTDISGKICYDENGNTYTEANGWEAFYSYANWPEELCKNHTDATGGLLPVNSYLQIGGTDNSDKGFPLIGQVFAGGNGEATPSDMPHPDLNTALLEINDGSIVYAFGGGNRATVTEQNYIMTNADMGDVHDLSGLGETMYRIVKEHILNVAIDCYTEESDESDNKSLVMKKANVQRLFGGNNIADMSIQPKWNLISGFLTSVYSGGNMGRMTYYNPSGTVAKAASDADPSEPNWNLTPRGLQINIDKPMIHIGSLFGGCRMADVIPGGFDTNGEPKQKDNFADDDYYGATVNISDGYIDNVYGGNDVSGTVYFGTNVNLSGAISGNVYGSGNGFYQYQWDKDYRWDNASVNPTKAEVVEALKDNVIYYKVKPRTGGLGGDDATPTQKLLTINHYRPSVEKAFLNIAGLKERAQVGTPGDAGYKPAVERRVAYVKGNVYCGGNASTVLEEAVNDNSFTKFKIGSFVTLNGVFMGSDGYAFSQSDYIRQFEEFNPGLDMTAATTWEGVTADIVPDDWQQYYPHLLNLYMKAVEMRAQPKEFNLNLPLEEAYIGTYCGGGNRGSMLVEKKVGLDFHHDIVIYDKVVGACLDANVVYKNTTAYGGYTRPLSSDPAINPVDNFTKLSLNVASQFAPLMMDVPDDKVSTTMNKHGENYDQAVLHGFLYPRTDDGKPVETNYTEDTVYGDGCNIYGGCYASGEVMGGVDINLNTNMLRYVNDAKLKASIAANVPCFNVYGAGFGGNSHVWGNVDIRMDRKVAGTIGSPDPLMGTANITLNDQLKTKLGGEGVWDVYHSTIGGIDRKDYPSTNNIFGGGRNGELIGNSLIDVKNGLVYQDIAAGCYAANMYGSGQVIVGYPTYYVCDESAEYNLIRKDKWNTDKFIDEAKEKPVLVNKLKYLKGEIVPKNVWSEIVTDQQSNFTQKTDETTDWNNIDIRIGGGVYGGGYSLTNTMTAVAGSYTTWKLKDTGLAGSLNKYNFNGRKNLEDNLETFGYGGNVSIVIGDRIENTNAGYEDKDHIHISTLKATLANFAEEDYVDINDSEHDTKIHQTDEYASVIGKFSYDPVTGKYNHLNDHRPEKNGDTKYQYYNLSGEGGIYGDGHLVFCEGFRAADITGYGYAEGTVAHPVLMNTFQRLDMININDCCLMLQGAQDFATDQTDATIYSMTRVDELNMTSSLVADEPRVPLSYPEDDDTHSAGDNNVGFDKTRVRNYLGFFNNIHFLGSITSNDEFLPTTGAKFHDALGTTAESETYYDKKQGYINAYTTAMSGTPDDATKSAAQFEFKKRNVGTARNTVGINNGYCLRIQNQHYVNTPLLKGYTTYYGPVIGVIEVKLLTLVEGEGGGYVYADNIHKDKHYEGDGHNSHSDGDIADDKNGHDFLNISGNFVFPGILKGGTGSTDAQYIVDDCFPVHYGTNENAVVPGNDTKAEAHYWFVEGNKYFFHTTLTGYTFSGVHDPFQVKTNDPNILFSGLANGMRLKVTNVTWNSRYSDPNYETDLKLPYNCTDGNDYTDPKGCGDKDERLKHTYGELVEGVSAGALPYLFNMEVGTPDAWKNEGNAFVMYRESTKPTSDVGVYNAPTNQMPTFNVKLFDNVNNAPSGHVAEYYEKHLSEPEEVKVILQARRPETSDETAPDYTYTVTIRIVYLQGPSFSGGPLIKNCALPGERIHVTSEGISIETTPQLPVTKYGWKLLQPDGNGDWQKTDDPSHPMTNPIPLDASFFKVLPNGHLDGELPAYYYQNGWNIAYTFTAGGTEFVVPPLQESSDPSAQPKDYEKMFLIHNYHRMKETVNQDLKIMEADARGARIYIEDEEDLQKFIYTLNQPIPAVYYTEETAAQENFSHLVNDENGVMPGTPGYKETWTPGFDPETQCVKAGDVQIPERPPFDFADRYVYLMNDLDLLNTAVLSNFKGTFDGFGHTLTIKDSSGDVVADGTYRATSTCVENNVASINNIFSGEGATVANLLVLDGSADEQSDDYETGKFAYELNNYYLAKREAVLTGMDTRTDKDKYVESYYENGDYQYAGVNPAKASGNPFLRTDKIPNYGSTDTRHNIEHPHDVRRWNNTEKKNLPLYEVDYASTETYDANHDGVADKDGDFNDYIYFGQSIVAGSRGSYQYDQKLPHVIVGKGYAPIHEANGQLNNMNDRVFLADGYYHTKENKGFYHNVGAVVIDPYTTAVAFGDESMSIDQPELGIKSFNVDSNLDYAGTGADYDNATTGHVTQNLLVYTMKSNAHDKDAREFMKDGIYGNGATLATDKSREQDIRYHTLNPIEPTPASGALFDIANFHLVDKQDFNAPLAFNVTNRAWYERMPDRWRNVDRGYGNASAWEGICLPFTAKKVSASENKEISHFYGEDITLSDGQKPQEVDDHTLHHEYWLTGFKSAVDASGSTIATFLRPSATNLSNFFYDVRQENGTYNYQNDYFKTLDSYSDHYGTRDDKEMTGGTKEWYEVAHEFNEYVYLSKTVPYIIAFPGEDFYEFSMEGTDYDRDTHKKDTEYPQLVTFETLTTTIAVSDDEEGERTSTANGYNHVGTYMRKDKATRPVYEAPSMLDGGLAMNARGTKFEAKKDADSENETFDYVLPFRTYMKATTASPAKGGCIWINDGADYVPQIPVEEEEESDIEQGPGITIKIDRLHVIVNSTFEEDRRLDVYTPAGQMVMIHTAKPGRTDFYLSKPGLYVIGNKRFLVRNK